MGKYRIQKLARSWTVTIPKKWIDENNLNRGSKIEYLVQEDGNLLVKPVIEEIKEEKG